MSEYLKLPWNMKDTIENMRNLRDILINQVSNADHEGKGKTDAEEIKFDFDRAISALEKQIPKQMNPSETRAYGSCPECGRLYWKRSHVLNHCDYCGQRLEGKDE